MKHVTVYTDGACEGNPGPGGWAAVLTHGTHRRELCGGAPATTNNRMELWAAIEALRALKEPCAVEFHTDSEYLRRGVTEWLSQWKGRGWRTAARQPVRNADLWQQLDEARSRHRVAWRWVKGHAGNAENERCDSLARAAIAKLRETHSPEQLRSLLQAFRKSAAIPGGQLPLQ